MFHKRLVPLTVYTSLLIGLTLYGVADETHPHHGTKHHSAAFDACARTCTLCAIECESCYAHCAGLVASDRKDHEDSMRLCNDCGELCRTAASFAARGSEFTVALCRVCADACDRCAEACGAFPEDPHLAACAKSCRECAAACRAMIAHGSHNG